MPSQLPKNIAVLVERFRLLSEEDQLVAYGAIQSYLRAGATVSEEDRLLAERREAFRVMRSVFEHYKLNDPKKLTVKLFNDAPESVREGWNASRIIRACGLWRFARDALAGQRPRETARQRALRSAMGLTKFTTDDYLAGVRAWLATEPPKLTVDAYQDWTREYNKARAEGELPYPGHVAVRTNLNIAWADILRVARNEITLDEAEKVERKERAGSTGEHDLITVKDIAKMVGRPTMGFFVSRKPGFPAPVVVIGDFSYWLREDVEAFLNEKPVPKREPNELGHLYVNARQAGEMLGIRGETFGKLKERPAAVFGGMNRLWRRADIERFGEERKARTSRPRRQGYAKR